MKPECTENYTILFSHKMNTSEQIWKGIYKKKNFVPNVLKDNHLKNIQMQWL